MANYKKHSTGWEYRLKYKDPFTLKYREKSERGFASKKEAQLAAADFERQVQGGYEQTDIPLAEYLEAWLKNYKEGTIRSNTMKQQRNNLDKHILPYFKKIMLREVKPLMYQDFLNHLADQGYSKSTVSIVHGTMYSAMDKAVQIGKLEKNPCVGAVMRGKEPSREVHFMDSDDIPRFLQATHKYGYIYWIFFKVLIETGLRKGEAAALKWSDIDLKEQLLTVDETLDFSETDPDKMFGATKTKASRRTIKISQALCNDLRFHASWQNQNKINLKDIYRHDLGLVLCREDGEPMPKSTLFNAFSRILKKCELPSMPIHSLRHTHAVLLLESGADMKYVQERLGHNSIQITSDVYSHISKKLEARSMGSYEEYTQNILHNKN